MSSNSAIDKMQSIPTLLETYSKNLENTNIVLNKNTTLLLSHVKEYDEILSPRLNRFKEEIDSIDKIIDSFVDTLQKNLKRISA